jgi:hypothetical protein
MHCLVA